MRAGELDRLITIKENKPTESATGDEMQNLVTLGVEWARVTSKASSEPFKSEQEAGFEVLDFKIRYKSKYEDYRLIILYKTRTYDIESIVEIGRREALLITGKAKVT